MSKGLVPAVTLPNFPETELERFLIPELAFPTLAATDVRFDSIDPKEGDTEFNKSVAPVSLLPSALISDKFKLPDRLDSGFFIPLLTCVNKDLTDSVGSKSALIFLTSDTPNAFASACGPPVLVISAKNF